jgi:uncharacterized protein (DUF1501 family)
MNRRAFLKSGAIAMFGAGMVPGWLSRAALASGQGRRKILVAIFQRGAADGLNVAVPHGDASYYTLRPSIAIPKGDIVDLDGFFGLNPALSSLQGLYAQKRMAIIHAAGSPDPTRSHFDAQDYMESGTPGLKSTGDGWLNRALAGPAASPLRAVAMGQTLPRALRGKNSAVAIAGVPNFRLRDEASASAFEQLYEADSGLSGAARETFAAMKLLRSLPSSAPMRGVSYPATPFGRSLQQIAQLIRADAGLEVAFADMGGWDTHVNEVAQKQTEGRLANLLTGFGAALTAFCDDLGERLNDVVIVTMSEFGRTARENGNRGTDHGHATAMLLLGGGVRGGKVYGRWPGLARERLYEGRDLAVTTDFRALFAEVAGRQLGIANPASLFPGWTGGPQLGVLS